MRTFLVVCLVTFVAAPLIRKLMLRHGVFDIPNERSSHTVVTPRGGGLACLLGVASGFLWDSAWGKPVSVAIVTVVMAMAFVGFVDDCRSIPALPRLCSQIVAGLVIGWHEGGLAWLVPSTIVVLLTVNAVNFMDGINGITGLHLALWGVTATFIGQSHGSDSLTIIGIVTAAATIGFLPWNFPCARLFLGDVGSYLFGTLAAVGIIAGAHSGMAAQVAAPLALYFTDVTTTLARRIARRESITQAHRAHIYQRLIHTAGLSHGNVAVGMVIAAACITMAWLFTPPLIAVTVTCVVLVGYITSPIWISRIARIPTHRPREI
jgi:UDP-N-acetylmuramyl pentapeptide phosphotransferase/UDP-N-acetylglucosamine-1-phosphate transferase